jgi:quinol monooxygenase YgiN
MLIALGDIYAQIPRRAEVRELMRATQEQAREQPGCAYFAFAETLDDPGHFVVVEEWSDQGALDGHYRSPAFADYQARIGELIVRSSEFRVHSVQASSRPLASAPLESAQDD